MQNIKNFNSQLKLQFLTKDIESSKRLRKLKIKEMYFLCKDLCKKITQI